MKFALFYLGSYINLVLSALLVSVLYLGGWGFPVPVEWLAGWLGQSVDAPLVQVITGATGIVMTVLKAYLLVFIAILLRWTTPRVRLTSCWISVEISASAGLGQSSGQCRSQARFSCGLWWVNTSLPR